MTFKIIFLAGIHGAGKGTISKTLANKYQLESFSASELIKKEKLSEVDFNKVVKGASENQNHLKKAIKKLVVQRSFILLDGHFCLNSEDGIFKVSIETFRALDLDAIFLIIEEPSVIYERLLKRDGNSMNLKLIEELQYEEVIQAKLISNTLQIPLLISESGITNEIEIYLTNLLAG